MCFAPFLPFQHITATATRSPGELNSLNHQDTFAMSDLSSRRYIVNNYAHLRYSRYAQHVNMILPSPEHGLLQPVTDTNMRDSFELFLLGDEEKKVTEAIDTRKCTPLFLHCHHCSTSLLASLCSAFSLDPTDQLQESHQPLSSPLTRKTTLWET